MKDIDWKSKLASRKLWALVAALIISVGVIFGLSDELAAQITGVCTAIGSIMVYILGEAKVDAARELSNTTNEIIIEDETDETDFES